MKCNYYNLCKLLMDNNPSGLIELSNGRLLSMSGAIDSDDKLYFHVCYKDNNTADVNNLHFIITEEEQTTSSILHKVFEESELIIDKKIIKNYITPWYKFIIEPFFK